MAAVTVPTTRGDLPAYLACPQGEGPFAGVVLIHDVFGMTTDLVTQADWLASEGFLALAPDLFSRGRKIACVRAAFRDLARREGRTFEDVKAASAWLARDHRCSGRLGIAGFCLGGGFALLMAPGHGYGAASVNYGQVPADASAWLSDSCPMVASFGQRDRTLRGAAARLESALTEASVPHDVKEYPRVGHGFMNRHHGLLPLVMHKVGGIGYDEVAAADSRRRITEFFRSHLSAPASQA